MASSLDKSKWIGFAFRLIIALILLQTLRYKFTAHPDSVYIFEKIGMEPFGRIGVGVMELIASILILVPSTIWLGALLAVGLMLGAVGFHLFILGIEVHNDGGSLFYMALLVLVLGLVTLWQHRKNVPLIGNRL